MQPPDKQTITILNDALSIVSRRMGRKSMHHVRSQGLTIYDASLSNRLYKAIMALDEDALAALPPPIPNIDELVSVQWKHTRRLMSPLYMCCLLHNSAESQFGKRACFKDPALFGRFMRFVGRLLARHKSRFVCTIESPMRSNDDYSNLTYRKHVVLSCMLTMPFQNAEQEFAFVQTAARYGFTDTGNILLYSGMRRFFPLCIGYILSKDSADAGYRRLDEIFEYPEYIETTVRMIAGRHDLKFSLPFAQWRERDTRMTPLHIAAGHPRLNPLVPILLEHFPMVHPSIRDSKGRTAEEMAEDEGTKKLIAAEADRRLRQEMPMVKQLIRALRKLPSDLRRSILGDLFPAMGAMWSAAARRSDVPNPKAGI